jgi:hypothetical protein
MSEEWYNNVVLNHKENDYTLPQVSFYAKFIVSSNDTELCNKKEFEESLEFEKFVEGKRPQGNCIIWGCKKKTTRKCKCGCLQFVCRECCLCVVN